MAITFVVEDGSGLANSNAYVSVAEADTYHENMGNAAWALATTANKQTALIRATKSMDAWYNGQWKGLRSSSTQALDWPRTEAYDELGNSYLLVPTILKNAVAEAALIELATPGSLLVARERGGSIKSEKADILTVEYFEGAPSATTYPTISSVITPLLDSGGGGQLKVYRV